MSTAPDSGDYEDPASTLLTLGETEDSSSHMVGPAWAQDAQALQEDYASLILNGDAKTSQLRPNPYNIYSSDMNKPVLYLNVGKIHGGLKRHKAPGIDECEALENMLQPFTKELVNPSKRFSRSVSGGLTMKERKAGRWGKGNLLQRGKLDCISSIVSSSRTQWSRTWTPPTEHIGLDVIVWNSVFETRLYSTIYDATSQFRRF